MSLIFFEFGAGDGNRTHVISLEGWSSTIELHPRIFFNWMVEGGGFEPPKAEPADLQSDPFGRSGTPPLSDNPVIICHQTHIVNESFTSNSIYSLPPPYRLQSSDPHD